MDEDATWYGSRPRPRPHCVRWGRSSPAKGYSTPSPLFGPCLLWPRSPISATAELLFTNGSRSQCDHNYSSIPQSTKLKCGPMPNVMADAAQPVENLYTSWAIKSSQLVFVCNFVKNQQILMQLSLLDFQMNDTCEGINFSHLT